MISKKIILSIVVLSLLATGKMQAGNVFSDKAPSLADTTKKWLGVFGKGLAHGIANNVGGSVIKSNSHPREQTGLTIGLHVLTFSTVTPTLDISADVAIVHGLGQLIGESVKIEKNEKGELALRVSLVSNSTLLMGIATKAGSIFFPDTSSIK